MYLTHPNHLGFYALLQIYHCYNLPRFCLYAKEKLNIEQLATLYNVHLFIIALNLKWELDHSGRSNYFGKIDVLCRRQVQDVYFRRYCHVLQTF